MKNLYLLYLVFLSSLIWAQNKIAKSENTVEITKWKYLDLIQNNPKIQQDNILENGRSYTKTYLDSVLKTKDKFKYIHEYFFDTIQNKVNILLRKRSDAETKEAHDQLNSTINKDKSNRKKLLGSKIQNLNFKDINGTNYTSQNLLGRVVVLNFWFTKCAPYIKEMPDLNKLKEKYGHENIVYLAITYDSKELVDKFLKRIKLDFTIIPDEKKTIDSIGVDFFPTNILLDKEGKVIFVNDLFEGNGIDKIDKIIKKQLKNI